jgi:hypothetical protein
MSKIDTFLYIYSTGFIALLVINSALNSDKGPNSLIVGAVLAPVALYLIFSLIHTLKNRPQKSSQKSSSVLNKLINEHQTQLDQENLQQLSFLNRFFHQKNPFFLITLTLLAIALTTTITKSVLTFTTPTPFVNPLSETMQTTN